jgi:hypothetical protein
MNGGIRKRSHGDSIESPKNRTNSDRDKDTDNRRHPADHRHGTDDSSQREH